MGRLGGSRVGAGSADLTWAPSRACGQPVRGLRLHDLGCPTRMSGRHQAVNRGTDATGPRVSLYPEGWPLFLHNGAEFQEQQERTRPTMQASQAFHLRLLTSAEASPMAMPRRGMRALPT